MELAQPRGQRLIVVVVVESCVLEGLEKQGIDQLLFMVGLKELQIIEILHFFLESLLQRVLLLNKWSIPKGALELQVVVKGCIIKYIILSQLVKWLIELAILLILIWFGCDILEGLHFSRRSAPCNRPVLGFCSCFRGCEL